MIRIRRAVAVLAMSAVPARFTKLTRNVLVPGWIVIVGCVLLASQPLGVPGSLLGCVVGLLIVPARALMPAPTRT